MYLATTTAQLYLVKLVLRLSGLQEELDEEFEALLMK